MVGQDGAREVVHGIAVGDVEGMGGQPQALLAQWCSGGFEAGGVDVGEGQMAAVRRELASQGAADAGACASDDRDLPR
ncbi:hypothetical protein FQZ97_1069760 [compost metagenome]